MAKQKKSEQLDPFASTPGLLSGRYPEVDVPLGSIDKCPWNVKDPIHGVYKNGLTTSLAYWALHTRPHVWPRPNGRYMVLNGNQRLDLIQEVRETQLICSHFGLELNPVGLPKDAKAFRAVRSDPANAEVVQGISLRVLQSAVPVVRMDVDEDDARIFVATCDRNQGRVDEGKVVTAYEHISEVKRRIAPFLDKMVRPDRALVNPLPPPEIPLSGPRESTPLAPVEPPRPPADEIEARYGPPPPPPPPPPSAPRTALISAVFSFTPEGYEAIFSGTGLLKARARAFREERIIERLNELGSILAEEGSAPDLDSVILEIALRVTDAHIKAAKDAQTERPV